MIKIREYQQTDQKIIHKVFSSGIRSTFSSCIQTNLLCYIDYSLKSDLSNISEYYNGKRGRFWVAIDEETQQIVGHIALDATTSADVNTVELRRCSVDSKCRKRGIGRVLVEHFIQKAQQDFNANHIFLTTTSLQVPAIQLYKKCGFLITNPIADKFGFNVRVVKMEKHLFS